MTTMHHPRDPFAYPETRWANIAVIMIAAALGIGGISAAAVLFVEGLVTDTTFIPTAWIAVPLALMGVCGACAVVAALVAVIVEQERSVFVGLALFTGVIVAWSAVFGL